MATTKLWKFKSRLDRLIDYAINGEKTENKLYVSGINCMPDTAFYEMQNVKKQFFKTKGIECFHGYQSFATGEVTPEQAHKIGVELAREVWGDKFQVIVSTHLNTDNIHNHFVLNSVSFVDGKRFCNTKKDYALMRITSDKLCEEYGLSVLKKEDKYNKYASSSLYKELMKDSIDYAIANARDYNEFIKILQDLDYIVTDRNDTLSIRREPYKRNTRIERQFGNEYSKENIFKRILETQPEYPYSPDPYLLINRSYNRYNEHKKQSYALKGSIRWLIFYYEKLFGINTEKVSKSNYAKLTPYLIQEIKKMDEFSKQAEFLVKYNIETDEQLLDFKKSTYDKLAPLTSERENLWKKHKRAKTEDEKTKIENQIVEISKKIAPIAEDIKHCQNIIDRMETIQKYELHQEFEKDRYSIEKDLNNKHK
ncbi:MAG: relaxase/mobilization nuclease domain-containing protein [Clostridia bacterium]|nr:relaxase/mobilization nuclease domain-containing protein [Clostridia bacterium]